VSEGTVFRRAIGDLRMEMWAEQKIAGCDGCGQSFVVQYVCGSSRTPSEAADVLTALTIACPRPECGQRQRLLLPVRLRRVVVKPLWSLERVLYALAGA
jgi:hypothetical protein